jgi:hypothetical protein
VLRHLHRSRAPHAKRPEPRLGELFASVQTVRGSIRVEDVDGATSCNQSNNVSCADRIAAMSDGELMPPYAEKRSDGLHIGRAIKEMVRLMLEEGYSRDRAADEVGFNRKRAKRALERPHIIVFRRREKAKLLDELAAGVPKRLHELMLDGSNQNAAVRACVALHQMSADEQAPRRPAFGTPTPGLTIQIVSDSPRPLTINSETPLPAPSPPPLIEQAGENDG